MDITGKLCYIEPLKELRFRTINICDLESNIVIGAKF
jgi:hypothetical protein